MPRVDNRPLTSDPNLMANIQSEVSAESRPLLMFIMKYAKYLAAIIAAIIIILLGMAAYRYIEHRGQEQTLDAMARIMARPADSQQIADLEALLKDCPGSMKSAVAVAIVKSATDQNNPAKAAEGYAKVAAGESGTALGIAAAINQAGELMKAGSYAEGVKVLQGLLPKVPQETVAQVKMMLAEGASRDGQTDLAVSIYEELAATGATEVDSEYCKTMARDLKAAAEAAK